jgi:alpha,alpha-trehalase
MSVSMVGPRTLLVIVLAFAGACATPAPLVGTAVSTLYEPSRDLGQLFHDVQMARVFPDGKTFVDARPRDEPAAIVARYQAARSTTGFDLATFVRENFEAPEAVGGSYRSDRSHTMEEHIRALWPVLTRSADVADDRSSLIPLPNPYVVPGGRFREVYYWDSYFTMLGLVESGRTDLMRHMLDNFAHLIRTIGHIPNGNRTYYLSRSQPPYFAAMVGLYARATDTTQALRYLDAMEREHAFWMEGAGTLTPGQAHRRVVRLGNGALLNRYWDDRPQPRPESYREDFTLAAPLDDARRTTLYRNIRAAAESGWDFSSRWMRDTTDLRTLETTDLVPVDLNSLLYNLERTIAAFRAFRGAAGDGDVARRFESAAATRRSALLASTFEPDSGFFYDLRWRTNQRVTDRPTLAAAAPLYFGLASPEQARGVAARLERDFLKDGGFVTTLIASGQQWDAPNGWPPLQWLAMEGSRRYGRADVANRARIRWLTLNRGVYGLTGRMTEKYDVLDMSRRAGGGEYPTQDGFGWTNGVALALSAQERAQRDSAPARIPEFNGHTSVSSTGHVTGITLLTVSNTVTSNRAFAGITPAPTSSKERHRETSRDHPPLRSAVRDGVREHHTVVVARQR